MHIPDHYLSPESCVAMTAIMVPIWTISISKIKTAIRKEKKTEKLSLAGIFSAFTFIIMMFNIPLPGGTTGHAIGAAIAGIILGPYLASIVVSISLLVQALLFGDGGLLAFGANCFNMAFVVPFAGYWLYHFFKSLFSSSKAGNPLSAFIAGYISLNLAAFLAAIEFGIQPLLFKDSAGMPLYCPYPLQISIPAMLVPHLLVAGIAEGLITVSGLAFIKGVASNPFEFSGLKFSRIYAIIAGFILATPIGLLASGTAWGEWSKEELQNMFGKIPEGMAKGFEFSSPFPDYTFPYLPVSEVMGYLFSAIIGTIVILGIFKLTTFILMKDMKRRYI